jgi:hypothetical protein
MKQSEKAKARKFRKYRARVTSAIDGFEERAEAIRKNTASNKRSKRILKRRQDTTVRLAMVSVHSTRVRVKADTKPSKVRILTGD